MKVNPTEIARQMRKAGEDLKTTGEEWVRLGEQQIKLADKFEGSLIMTMNQLVQPGNNGQSPEPPKVEMTRFRRSGKLTIQKACELVLRQRGTPVQKNELYEAIVRSGCKVKNIHSMIMTMSRLEQFKSLGSGLWTLSTETATEPMKGT